LYEVDGLRNNGHFMLDTTFVRNLKTLTLQLTLFAP